ncbi:MAG: protease modulator HflC [Desulfohalobiaceae bacterium]|nr:protease modulator HflC [Desulfohalobiaceae bacterium]
MAVQKSPVIVVVVLVLLLLGISQTFYTVDQTQRALLLQMGKPVGGTIGPGLHFKLPFIQNVINFDHRILEYDADPAEIITKDKKTLVVDNYARWRIQDTLKFYRTARTEAGGVSRLDDIVYAEMRVAMGRYNLIDIVNFKRDEIMETVLEESREDLKSYGIKLEDVRIKRTDLPPENQKAIFARMSSERERMAKQYRSEGEEQAAIIRAEADKDRTIMLAEAERKSQVLRGEGDAQATKIYGDAYKQGEEFYAFTRSLEAYKKSLGEETSLVLTPDGEFFKYLR